jgi:hypothetical protein
MVLPMRYLLLLLKVVCYAALAFLLAGIAALVIVSQPGVCSRFDEGAINCSSPLYENIGYFGLTALFSSFLIGLPAIAGPVFLIRDLVHWRRARRAQA